MINNTSMIRNTQYNGSISSLRQLNTPYMHHVGPPRQGQHPQQHPMESWCPMGWCHVVNMAKSKCGRLIIWWAGRTSSPGVDGQKGLRLQFNSRQSSTVDTSIPFSARHFEYSIEYSTYIPCRQTAIGWPTVDSGA